MNTLTTDESDQSPRQIAIIGAESSGKTTLCRELAQRTGGLWVPEYARTYGLARQLAAGDFTAADVVRIFTEHYRQIATTLAQATAQNAPYVFIDTEIVVLYVWACHLPEPIPEVLRTALTSHSRFHAYFILEPDLPWAFDPMRSAPDAALRWQIFEQQRHILESLGISPHRITGSGEARINQAMAALS